MLSELLLRWSLYIIVKLIRKSTSINCHLGMPRILDGFDFVDRGQPKLVMTPKSDHFSPKIDRFPLKSNHQERSQTKEAGS